MSKKRNDTEQIVFYLLERRYKKWSSHKCPPESVYYAAEYLRLQGEIDNGKTKFTKLEVEFKKTKQENVKITTNVMREQLELQKIIGKDQAGRFLQN